MIVSWYVMATAHDHISQVTAAWANLQKQVDHCDTVRNILGVVDAARRARFKAERSLEPPSTSGVVWNFAPTASGGSHMGITSLDVSATYTKGVRPAVRAVLTSDLM